MNRKTNIDLLRVVSAAAVVVLHSVAAPLGNGNNSIPFLTGKILTVIHALTLWAVPVFFIITGYCLLLKPECNYKYCFLHIRKFVLALFTVGLFYALLEEVYSIGTVNVTVVFHAIRNVITGDLWEHMWFVYAMIGVYLVMPVIHTFIKQEKVGSIVLTAILFAFNIFLPVIREWLPIGVELPFGGYLFYVCVGGLAARYGIRRWQCVTVSIVGLISAVFASIHYNGKAAKPTDLLAMCFMALAVFAIFNCMEIRPSKILLALSNCSWGIYLFHPLFINIALKLLKIDFVSSVPYIRIPLLAVLVFVFSFALTYLLKKLPIVSNII